MFEISEVGDTIEKSSWWKSVIWFVAGYTASAAVFYIFVVPNAKSVAAGAAQQATLRSFAADLARNPVQVQLQSAKAELQAATQQRDACNAKFDRETILYDNSVLIDPGREWIIPADVDPILLTNRQVSYTHYDPKTKRESVHLKPLKQSKLE